MKMMIRSSQKFVAPRAALFARYDNDLDALVADMQRKTEEARVAGRKIVSLPPRRPKGWSEPAKKAGRRRGEFGGIVP